MSGAGLASFAEGFAGSYGARKDRQADAEQAARQDKMIAALGALPPSWIDAGLCSAGGCHPAPAASAMPGPVSLAALATALSSA
ncbi:hypothetical protein [Cereibacter changlensis]|uniref:hypothetical protein n=1 Tax=Cereibacter changlensis TaxID=402884 RepID=UPI004034BFE6